MLRTNLVLLALAAFVCSPVKGQPLKEFVAPNGVTSQRLNDIIRELRDSSQNIIVRDGPDIPAPRPVSGTPFVPREASRSEVEQALGQSDITPFKAAKERISEQFDPRIVGGKPAIIDDFPWQVILIAGETPPEIRSPFCGGSIVGYDWILTAAHCLDGIERASLIDIISGSTFPKYSGQGDRVTVSRMIIHPGYNYQTFENDIALLKLSRRIRLGKPISLASQDLIIPDNAAATVSGWGAVTPYSGMVDRLLKAEVPVVSNDTCNQAESYNNTIKAGMLCAGYREGGLDACQGDSGGPLKAQVNGKPSLIGVVSFGKGCALRLKYGVYTRVTAYAKWVEETMKVSVAGR